MDVIKKKDVIRRMDDMKKAIEKVDPGEVGVGSIHDYFFDLTAKTYILEKKLPAQRRAVSNDDRKIEK